MYLDSGISFASNRIQRGLHLQCYIAIFRFVEMFVSVFLQFLTLKRTTGILLHVFVLPESGTKHLKYSDCCLYGQKWYFVLLSAYMQTKSRD